MSERLYRPFGSFQIGIMAIFRREKSTFFSNSYLGDGTAFQEIAKRSFLLLAMALFFGIFLVISSSFLSPFGHAADLEGCYLYSEGSEDLVCQVGVLESEAQADCESDSECDFSAMFIPGASCSSYDECTQVLCSVDCDYHSLSICEGLGGRALEADEQNYWCSEGCCDVGNFCEYVDLRYECVERADQQGLSEDDITLITGSEITPSYCQSSICGVVLEDASLIGFVVDLDGNALSGAEMELSSSISTVSSSDGSYSFTNIDPGSYILRVSLDGYSDVSSSISLDSAEQSELDITLSESGETYTLDGFVFNQAGDLLSSVAICYLGSDGSSDCGSSSSDGSYTFEELAVGTYTFTLTKYGYLSTEVELIVSSHLSENLVIDSIDFQGVSGFTWLDSDGDGELEHDGSESVVYGASIFVDGVLLGNSEYPEGNYEVYLEEGDYTIHATFQDYVSEELFLEVVSGETTDLGLLLSKTIGECSYGEENDQKPVEELFLEVVSGEAELELNWDKPCAEVSGYKLELNGEYYQALSPLATTFIDSDLEWDTMYSYSLWAVYTDGPLGEDGEHEVRLSSSSADASVTLGSSHCEGYAVGEQFCLFDSDSTSSINERKQVYSCDGENNIVAVTDCTALDDSDSSYFCSAISEGSALCKDAGECGVWPQGADPFGLYYESDSCYGEYQEESGYDNFCYYDYSYSIVDACFSCTEVTSCFDYQSEDACGNNNCLGQSCHWIDTSAASVESGEAGTGSSEFLDYSAIFPVTDELGKGYCAPAEEKEIAASSGEFCSLCGSEASLFENNYCMPEVCNSLGSCFSDNDASECLECGDTPNSLSNCYTYSSSLECSGGLDTRISSGLVIGSDDQCSWNVCSWQESSTGAASVDSGEVIHSFFVDTGYCFKDGNGDGVDDCTEFTAGEYSSCQVDVISPQTTVVTDSFEVISTVHSEVSFLTVDQENPLGSFAYCLAPADSPACDDFEYLFYEGLLGEEEILVNLTNSSFILGSIIDGESYLLRYFSLDKYYNQESVLETYVFIDTEEPSYDIEYLAETSADISSLSVYLSNMNEPVSCDFNLEEILPSGSIDEVSTERDSDKEAIFENLLGVIYSLEVTCTDDYGNSHIENEEIVFDLEQDITLIYPEYEGVVSETEIAFSVETAVSSVCTLYDTDSGLSLAAFSADEGGKLHETNSLSGYYEGEYAGNIQVVCLEQLTGDILEDYFFFTIDFTGPDTQIILSEGERSEEPSGFAWEEFFIETAIVGFSCSSDGFECANTYYCLGEGCEYAAADGYTEYVGELLIEQSTEICYYSVDAGGLFGYPDCGEILIEGYGLVLVSPEQYYYEDEIWGVSNTAIFDWAFTTKVDTGICTFDFNDGFDIYSQPAYKTIEAESDNYYVYPDFPGDVLSSYGSSGDVKTLYVACEDYRGEVGPATLMNLEYDPSAPEIGSAYADPDFVTEGIETFLYVNTDDKTVCRFSDLTADESSGEILGSYEYDTMEYGFEGELEGILDLSHISDFEFSFTGAQKNYLLAAQCKNGAGDFSEAVEIEFEVDYSVEGYIAAVSPEGYVLPGEYSLEVETSKNAICEVDGISFEETGGVDHTYALGVLEERDYQYVVSCRIGEVSREAEVIFSVDATAPVIDTVDDGSYSCSLEQVSFFPASLDSDIDLFYYEVYVGDSGIEDESLGELLGENFTETDTGTSDTLVASGSLPFGNSSSVDVSLTENASYFVRVSAQDFVGNLGESVDSDGFIATDPESELCLSDSDEPSVAVTTGVACNQVAVSLDCSDTLGCKEILYGKSGDSSSCVADEIYYGGALSYEGSGWICYSATDSSGNNITGSEIIDFPDSDGDGIANSCDLCGGSSAGSAVDSDGCSFGETKDDDQTDDYDSDGLPDTWEKLFDQTSCEFDYLSRDTDNDGITDGDEDYDGDGLHNYEEYRNGYNPCLSDAPASDDGLDLDDSIDTDYDYGDSTPTSSKGGIAGKLLFIFGLLMAFSGIGGLIYYYTQTLPGKKVVSDTLSGNFGRRQPEARPSINAGASNVGSRRSSGVQGNRGVQVGVETSAAGASPGIFAGLRDKVFGLRRVHEGRRKDKSRTGVFDEFTQETPHLGHFEKHIRSRGASLNRLDKVTDTYSEHREEVRAGLKPHEKSVFDKLDKISNAKANSEGGINSVASKEDAQDIFKKLRKLSDQRKE